MHILKRTRHAFIAGACLAIAAPETTKASSPGDFDVEAQQEYNSQIIDALLADGSPHAIVLAAASLTYVDKNSDSTTKRQHELLDRAAQMAPDDAWVQWVAAVSTPPTDRLSEPALALQRLDPDNGAVWLFQMNVAIRAGDNAGVTEALRRIGASSHYNDYFMTSSVEWQKFLSGFALPRSFANVDKPKSAQIAMSMALSRATDMALENYSSPMPACKPTEHPLAPDRREACQAAGRLMWSKSNSLLSMGVGASVLCMAGAVDAAAITREQKYFMEEATLASVRAMEDPDEFAHWQIDWLQTLSEVQAARNLLARAGIPVLPPADWKSNPQRFHERPENPEVD